MSDGFDDFDDSLLEAVEQYESSYFKDQQAAQTHHAQQPPMQRPQQPTQPPPQQQPQRTAPLADIGSIWNMFSSAPPPSSTSSSSCTGWAGKRLGPGNRAGSHMPGGLQQASAADCGSMQMQRPQQQQQLPSYREQPQQYQQPPGLQQQHMNMQQHEQRPQQQYQQPWQQQQYQQQQPYHQPYQQQQQQPSMQGQHLQQQQQLQGYPPGSARHTQAGQAGWQEQQQQHAHGFVPPAAGAHSGAATEDAVSAGPAAGAGSGPLAGAVGVSGANAAASAGTSGPGAASGAAASGGAAAASGGGCGPCVYSAKLSLGVKGMVEVSFTGYHAEIAAVCNAVPGARPARRDGAWSRAWLLPVDKVQQLEAALRAMKGVRIPNIEPLPPLVNSILRAARKQPDDSHLYERLGQVELAPGVSLEQRMMPFQREGVRFGLKAGGRLLIGDEMGLGKTVQACALAKCYQAEWPVLVVCPSSLRLSWAAALYDWLRVTDDRVLVVLKKKDIQALADCRSEAAARAMADFVVVSYDLLKDVELVLEALHCQVVILDESHCIKNGKAQRTKSAVPLLKNAKRAILLSGTPALSRPTELLTQLQALLPAAHITKAAFEERYSEVAHYNGFKKATGSKNEDELNKLLTATVMIRRRKAEVLKDLPAKMRKQVLLMLPARQRSELDNLRQRLGEVRKLTSDMHSVGQQVGGGLLAGMEQQQRTMIMQLWHDTARIKAATVAEYVADLLLNMSGQDDKFLVFAYHKELMDAIELGVNNVRAKNKEFKNMKHMRIDGSTPAKQREANVNMFQEQADCRVAILNIKAAGVGLTLTRASTVVFAELAWTPSEVQQAEDRAHRIGQTQCVSVQLLIVKDSIDELMWELLQNKLATTGQVLDGQAERLEVDKSGVAHRPRSNQGLAQARPEDDRAKPADSQQQSITNFFAKPDAGAAKRQKLGG